MDFGRRTNWIRVALTVVLAIGVPLTAAAQAPPGAGTTEPYTPAKDAKDLRAVLFNWMWHMGMLKGHDERDMVGTLEYQGKGTILVDGQPCALTKLRASTNYQTFSQRIQYTCTRANGQSYSNIEVVSGFYAWDEDTPGAEIGPTKGKVTTGLPACHDTDVWPTLSRPSANSVPGLAPNMNVSVVPATAAFAAPCGLAQMRISRSCTTAGIGVALPFVAPISAPTTSSFHA